VLKAGQSASEEEIIKFMDEKVSRTKRIKDVRFIDAIPKNPSGKILRKVLRDKANEDAAVMAKL
jgi:4-coumarate--CoA ligase